MRKVNKPSTKLPLDPNDAALLQCYQDLNAWRGSVPSDAYIDTLSLDLMAWSNKADSLRLKDFCRTRGLDEDMLRRWSKKYPKFYAAYRYALDGIASRRENGLIFKGWPATTIHATLGRYDRDWREEQNYREFLKAKMALFVAEHKHLLDTWSDEDLSNCFGDWIKKEERKIEDNSGDSPQT